MGEVREEREVGGNNDGTGCRRGGVGRDGGVEFSMIIEETKEGRGVDLAKASEE